MINFTRTAESPQSLISEPIRNYISQAIDYINNPDSNNKPEKPVSYRSSDLLEAFDRDFFSKCYLTEQKFTNSWVLDIEHFFPQSERPDLVYEWTNLFPADHYTNMIKPRITPNGGYLNPCEPTDDVETEIIYTLSVLGTEPNFEPANGMNIKAVNTCTLLNRLHNGHDDNTQNGTASLRHAIHKKYIEILHAIIEWQRFADGSQEKVQSKRNLKDLLSRKSSFTMLCRSIPAVRQNLPVDFFD